MPQPRKHISGLTAYQPGLPIEYVARQYGLDPNNISKLASNENPLGPSPKAVQAMAAVAVHRYPEQYALIQALADHTGVNPIGIVLGNGSNDVLDLIARAYLGKDDEAISSQYTFIAYQIATQAASARNVIVPALDYKHDLAALLRAITPATKVIWIANPNNPTGTFIPYDDLKQFLAKVCRDIVVVLDEAYYEYLSPKERIDTTFWLAEYSNLILVRTFSKIYGLAGMRVGYGLTTPEIADTLNRVRQPFNSNNLALAGAAAALGDQKFVAQSYESNAAGRTALIRALQREGIHCLPAHGNFVTILVPNAKDTYKALLQQGVIVRPLIPYNMPQWLRVTVGTPRENKHFLQALRQAVALAENKH
jgi:histidinol-phosphate aminotransferase